MPEHKKGLTWTTQDLTKAGRGVMGTQPTLATHSEILESFDTLTAVNGSWNVLGTLPALQSSPNIGTHSSCVFLSFMALSAELKNPLHVAHASALHSCYSSRSSPPQGLCGGKTGGDHLSDYLSVPSGPRKKALPKGARGIKCRLSDVHTQLSNENKLT